MYNQGATKKSGGGGFFSDPTIKEGLNLDPQGGIKISLILTAEKIPKVWESILGLVRKNFLRGP